MSQDHLTVKDLRELEDALKCRAFGEIATSARGETTLRAIRAVRMLLALLDHVPRKSLVPKDGVR